MKKLFLFMMIFAVSLSGCGGSDSGGGGTTLTAEDYPNVGICSTGTIDVTGADIKAALGAATTFIFMHKQWTSDADNPFICGKQGVWDPGVTGAFEDDSQDINTTALLSDILGGVLGNVFMCNDGFSFNTFNFGFHGSTTFRGELRFTANGTTYRVRLRFSVTGPDADATLASLGLAPANISLTDEDGNALTTVADIIDLFVANPTNITVNVVSNSTTHITASGGLICAGTQ